jgi:hypothetical protein
MAAAQRQAHRCQGGGGRATLRAPRAGPPRASRQAAAQSQAIKNIDLSF